MDIERLRKVWGGPIAIILGMLVYFMPIHDGLSLVGHAALALFVGSFILFLTEAVPLAVTALAVVPIAVLMGITKISPGLAPFASSSLFLMFGAFILAAGMIESKLAERIMYLVLKIVGCTATRITLGITIGNIILSFLVPSSTARVAILLPVCLSIIDLFGAEGRTKFGVNLLLTLTLTNATIASGILTATVPNPVTVEFIAKAGGDMISYMDWLIIGFPPALIMTIVTWGFIQFVFKPEHKEIPGGKKYIAEALHNMGPMSYAEKYTLAVFLLVVALWMTGSITNLDSTTACFVGGLLMFIPRFGVITWKTAQKHISWNVLVIVGGGLSLGTILFKSGASKWLAEQAFHLFGLHSLPIIGVLLIIMFICQFMHFFFVGTTVMATAMLPMVISLAETIGVSAELLALPAGMIIGGYPVLMFYCTNPNVLVYGTGQLEVGDFPKVGIPIAVVGCIVYGICAITYWKWLGLF